jgi:hypothetical protein
MTFPTGTEPVAVVVGDFRSIGRLDLAVADRAASSISVLLGNGDGSFRGAVNYPVSTNPRYLAVGRFRGSQSPLDLAVVNHGDFSTTSSVGILLGNGDGSFRAGATYTVGQDSDAESVAVGDFRGTGKLDLAVADYRSGTVNVLLGNGDGTFQPGATYSAGANPLSVAVADFNGDGRPDLVVANRFGGTVSVLLGNGNGSFQAPIISNGGTEPFALAVGRFRGNQSPQDVAVVSRSGNTVSVLRGNGNGTFQAPVSYATGTSPWSVAMADFNRDGNPDLVVANRDDGTVSVLLGNGDGSFQSSVNSAAGGQQPFSVATGDFNGDGAPDVVVANRNSNNVGVLLNQQGATHLGLTAPATATAGTAFSLTVTALTAAGTVDPNYRGTVTFTSTDGQATLPANYAFTAADAGVHTFTNGVVLRTAGSQMITARDTMTTTITGTASVMVAAAAASTLAVAGFPATTVAGVAGNFTVTAKDPYGNTATGYAGTVHFTSSDSQATLPSNSTLTSGTGTFSATLKTAGSQSITATDTVTATITGTQSGITVVAAAVSQFAVSTSAANPDIAGTPFNVTVTAQDAYGNTATSYTGTVHFTSGDPYGASLPADYTFQPTDQGVHTFAAGAILYTAGSQSVTATDTGNPALAGSALVNVIAAPAVSFVVTAPGTAMTGVPFDFAVTATDPYANTDTGYAGTVVFSTMDPAGTFSPVSYTFQAADQGMAIFPQGATLNTVGTWDVTATDSSNPTITGSASVNVPAGPGPGYRDRSRTARSRLDDSQAISPPIGSSKLGMAAEAAENFAKSDGLLALSSSQPLMPTAMQTSWETSLRDQVFRFLTGAEHRMVVSEVGPDHVGGNGHGLASLFSNDAWLNGMFA